MNWEMKLAALKAFAPHHLEMRKPGDWWVSTNVEIAGRGMLEGVFGNGRTPEDAVNDHWKQLVTDLPADQYLRGGMSEHTVYARWNGYMWVDASYMRKQTPAA